MKRAAGTPRYLLAALGLLLLLVVSDLRLVRWKESMLPPVQGASVVSRLLDVLGELRTFIARSLWFKSDLYHHVMESQGIMWTKERDILVLYRMCTLLDPHFVEAYDVASYQLVMNFERPGEGFALLDEGLRNNPDSYLLRYSAAFLHMQRKHDARALQEGLVARELVVRDMRAVLEQERLDPQPAYAERKRELVIDFLNTVRILAHSSRNLRDAAQEERFLREWLEVRPTDPYAAPRLQALIAERAAPRGVRP